MPPAGLVPFGRPGDRGLFRRGGFHGAAAVFAAPPPRAGGSKCCHPTSTMASAVRRPRRMRILSKNSAARTAWNCLCTTPCAKALRSRPSPARSGPAGLRYGWFDHLAAQEEALIATAHTMSDQAETVLFRMARGTGLHGLGGIPPRRGYYVRPCLCLARAETEAYCAALGQHYVQDETNAQDLYAPQPHPPCSGPGAAVRQPGGRKSHRPAVPPNAGAGPVADGRGRRAAAGGGGAWRGTTPKRCVVPKARCWTPRCMRWSARCATPKKSTSACCASCCSGAKALCSLRRR